MKKSFFLVVLLLPIYLISTPAAAAVFQYPPEVLFSGTWQTTYPYQRNMLYHFNINPSTYNPLEHSFQDNQINSYVFYQGYLDPDLWSADALNYPGDVFSWSSGLFGGGNGYLGVVGPGLGMATITMGNIAAESGFKIVYAEAGLYTDFDPAELFSITQWWLQPQAGYEVLYQNIWGDPANITFDGTWYHSLAQFYGIMAPNPSSETINMNFNVLAGNTVWVDYIHIATESAVPIPSAVWILGSGLIGLTGFRKKIKK